MMDWGDAWAVAFDILVKHLCGLVETLKEGVVLICGLGITLSFVYLLAWLRSTYPVLLAQQLPLDYVCIRSILFRCDGQGFQKEGIQGAP